MTTGRINQNATTTNQNAGAADNDALEPTNGNGRARLNWVETLSESQKVKHKSATPFVNNQAIRGFHHQERTTRASDPTCQLIQEVIISSSLSPGPNDEAHCLTDKLGPDRPTDRARHAAAKPPADSLRSFPHC